METLTIFYKVAKADPYFNFIKNYVEYAKDYRGATRMLEQCCRICKTEKEEANLYVLCVCVW